MQDPEPATLIPFSKCLWPGGNTKKAFLQFEMPKPGWFCNWYRKESPSLPPPPTHKIPSLGFIRCSLAPPGPHFRGKVLLQRHTAETLMRL